MKAISKIGAISAAAALAVIAGAAPAMADAPSDQTQITGTLAGSEAVSVTQATASITLTPGATATADAGNVVVNSNEGYSLSVSDANSGYLTDGDDTLGSPLEVDATTDATDGAAATTTGPTSLASSVPLGGSTNAAGDSGDTYDVTLSQPVSWADAPGEGYTDTLTYTVAPSVGG